MDTEYAINYLMPICFLHIIILNYSRFYTDCWTFIKSKKNVGKKN